ncbi:hypothetical protein GWI33_002221 [Rhynchophorus ferrugineus]|uniref:Uncharacterized protein n=1 Tax=Rhynchophorus ferrugineus TaxID=354439 RepID=A0A834LX94_RHYFE|nr:hypothetical protein GWI33_002221 [Rhynchophorus ferrugineus]
MFKLDLSKHTYYLKCVRSQRQDNTLWRRRQTRMEFGARPAEDDNQIWPARGRSGEFGTTRELYSVVLNHRRHPGVEMLHFIVKICGCIRISMFMLLYCFGS